MEDIERITEQNESYDAKIVKGLEILIDHFVKDAKDDTFTPYQKMDIAIKLIGKYAMYKRMIMQEKLKLPERKENALLETFIHMLSGEIVDGTLGEEKIE
jgi:hypothetical protein